jgi:hypothetical protein
MKKRYQDDEFWTAVNPLTGKREIVDREASSFWARQLSDCIMASDSTGM